MKRPIVSIKGISKRFGSVDALDKISIDIQHGEIFALLGPSGCGKSTLLRIISGFEQPSEGELLLDGEDLTQLPPNKRPINMVFQSYAVFPHMNVEQNVSYGLKMDKLPRAEIKDRVAQALEQVHLAEFAQRKPDQLSGGQRQRVALARALVKQPRVLLLDEPLSALDAKLRDAMRLELVKLQERVGITFIIVTHDQSEAMAMADRIAVLESGKLRQVSTPAQLYEHPVDSFVADFIGSINTFEIEKIEAADSNPILHSKLLGQLYWHEPVPVNNAKVLAIRPEHIIVSTAPPTGQNVVVQGTLGDIAFQGQHSIAEIVLTNGQSMSAIVDNALASSLPDSSSKSPVWAHWNPKHMLLLP
jgi:spermidine/putrescine ABC transporter ATP-binding subunit